MSTDLLQQAARALGHLLPRVVFLGGATVALWLNDPAARAPRVTYDVDVVAEVTTIGAYASFQEQLRGLRFREDIDSGVTCRWRHADSGLILDAIPLRHELAGFTDRWLKAAAGAAVHRELAAGTVIRVIPPQWLLVVKLEAHTDRGRGDLLASRDFEDIVLLVDGRPELVDEVNGLPGDARAFVTEQLTALLSQRMLDYGVEGALAAADARERADTVTLPRLRRLAGVE